AVRNATSRGGASSIDDPDAAKPTHVRNDQARCRRQRKMTKDEVDIVFIRQSACELSAALVGPDRVHGWSKVAEKHVRSADARSPMRGGPTCRLPIPVTAPPS